MKQKIGPKLALYKVKNVDFPWIVLKQLRYLEAEFRHTFWNCGVLIRSKKPKSIYKYSNILEKQVKNILQLTQKLHDTLVPIAEEGRQIYGY